MHLLEMFRVLLLELGSGCVYLCPSFGLLLQTIMSFLELHMMLLLPLDGSAA